MSKIYSKYLSINENKKDIFKNKKCLKEGYSEGYSEAENIIYETNISGVWIDRVNENDDAYIVYLECEYENEEEREDILNKAVNSIEKYYIENSEKYPFVEQVVVEDFETIVFYVKEEIDESSKRKMFRKSKKLSEKNKKTLKKALKVNEESEIKSYERTIKKIEKDLEDNGFEVVDSGVEKEKGFEIDGRDFVYYWGYVNLRYKIADENECRKIKDIISGYTFDNSEDNVNCFEGEKTIDIKMGHGSVDEACSKKRKRLSEKDSKTFNKAFNDFKNLVRDIAKEIGIDMYIDDIWTNSENEGKVIVDFDKKVPSQKAEALRKSLEDDIRVEKITKKDNGFVVIFKEKYRNLEESIKRKRLKESNTKRISFKQFKKLKESKMRKSLFSKRKLNESDSVTIEIDFDNYYECLRCIFKDANENLPRDQIYWYTELGMEFGVDPNSMYEWIKNEAELLSVDEIKEYKDLGDVSDEEAIDFAQERGYYMGEVNGDVYFLVPLGE